MFINPKTAIEKGWIKFPDWMTPEQQQKCIQPNALDITADKIFLLDSFSEAMISEDGKVSRKIKPLDPVNGFWLLDHQQVFDVMSDFYVEIPEGVAAELTIRSTLNRAGLALNSGIWDSGFKGNIGAIIHNRSGQCKLAPHTRMCQIKFIASDSNSLYSGGYNTDKGQHWTEKK